jgi:RNA polymerase sigma-70 factor (ECF subfamily)
VVGQHEFTEFIDRIRAGDGEAAAELVRRYEPLIRREVRMRLTDPALYRLFDSGDVCQSVLRSFFVRVAAGQYELAEPEDLARLLVTMARNKVASRARNLRRRPADRNRVEVTALEQLEAVTDSRPPPDEAVAGRDLLKAVLGRLSSEERRLADRRARGRTWPEVAAEVGGTAEGRRKQLTRALDRVLRELGLENE